MTNTFREKILLPLDKNNLGEKVPENYTIVLWVWITTATSLCIFLEANLRWEESVKVKIKYCNGGTFLDQERKCK